MKHPHKVTVEYISFLTSDRQPHLAAVLTSKHAEPKVVHYVSGSSGSRTHLVLAELTTSAGSQAISVAAQKALGDVLRRYKRHKLTVQVHSSSSEHGKHYLAVVAPVGGARACKAARNVIASPAFAAALADSLGKSTVQVKPAWLASALGPTGAAPSGTQCSPQGPSGSRDAESTSDADASKTSLAAAAVSVAGFRQMPWVGWLGWLLALALALALCCICMSNNRQLQDGYTSVPLNDHVTGESEESSLLCDASGGGSGKHAHW